MSNYYHMSYLDSEKYTNYFLNKFIPGTDFLKHSKTYKGYYNLHEFPEIISLGNTLIEKYKFPELLYMNVFCHRKDQPIHSDGTANYFINSSLNLPLSGYTGSKMVWYKPKDNELPVVSDAVYYTKKQVNVIENLEGSNKWVLVDSSIPHNIVGPTLFAPRITACLRFKGNPAFQDLIALIKTIPA